MRIAICIFIVILLGCEDEPRWVSCGSCDKVEKIDLYSDPSCWGVKREMIQVAVDRLNEMTQETICQDLVVYRGVAEEPVEVSEKEFTSHSVVCYESMPDWYEGARFDGKLGWSDSFKNVRIFLAEQPLMSDQFFLALVMHELFHYVGVNDHTHHEADVSGGDISLLNTEYTRGDSVNFCGVY